MKRIHILANDDQIDGLGPTWGKERAQPVATSISILLLSLFLT